MNISPGYPPSIGDSRRLFWSRNPSGQLLFQDDFQGAPAIGSGGGSKYLLQNGGVGAAIALDTSGRTFSLVSKNSLIITTPAVAGQDSGFSIQLPTPYGSSKIGLEAVWHSPSGNTLREVLFRIDYRTNSGMAQAGFKYINFTGGVQTQAWYYLNSAGGFTAVSNGGQVLHFKDQGEWHQMKMIIDFSSVTTPIYQSLLSNNLFLPLASQNIAGLNVASPDEPNICEPIIIAHSDAASAVTTYIGGFIVTQE